MVGLDSRLAGNLRRMMGIDDMDPVPQGLISRIVDVQAYLKPFARPIDIQHLAIILVDWDRSQSKEPRVEYDGQEATIVRRPGGKQEGKLYVRTADMPEGKYKIVDESEVRILEAV